MNAVIQCLCSTTPLVDYFLSWQFQMCLVWEKCEVARTFAELMDAMWFGEPDYISPEDFWVAVCRIHPPFKRGNQEDAQELLIYTLNVLHEDLTYTVERKSGVRESTDSCLASNTSQPSVITRLLQGVLRHDTVCLECGYTNYKYESFTVMSLPIPPGLQRSLQESKKCPPPYNDLSLQKKICSVVTREFSSKARLNTTISEH
ncbi:putative ubiquitin carboxyl-terminal hydrolase 50 [Bombina bombina]|uniref:putative ubiquitin carboxyl-terminal hydrolase 50 n=1 Tax=Bombina bombina TaxID=8345 RepID=UPI00235A82CA|nr:putative ubiquitin carboxyl-terminal hydrolase 50 [Bombina bombina]